MTDLTEMVEWLRGQIQADRQWAQQVIALNGEWDSWRWDKQIVWSHGGTRMAEARSTIIAAHVERHDPADTIARCEAELELIDEHAIEFPDYEDPQCRVCWTKRSDIIEQESPDPWPCRTLRILAHSRRHRPGWKEGWAP